MANNKDFKVKNGIQPTVYHEGLGTVTSGSEGYNLASVSYDSVSFSVSSQEASPQGVTFKSDGTKMYIVGTAGDDINEYTLSTAWDVSTASYVQSFSVSSQETAPVSVVFKPDGTKMYVSGSGTNRVQQYSLSTAWDVSTASYDSLYFTVGSGARGIYINSDGNKLYATKTNDTVNEYDISTAWDISTASFVQSFSVTSQETTPATPFFNPDGTKMYVIGPASDAVNEYELSTAWDISTASYTQQFSVSSQEANPYGLFFNPDGDKMYIVGTSTDTVYQYSMPIVYTNTLDLSTGSVFEITPTSDIQINLSNPADSGTVSQATLLLDGVDIGSSYDISIASYDSVSFSVSPQETTPTYLGFKDDGTKMYVLGFLSENLYQYSLSTAWDVSTASYLNSKNFVAQETSTTAFFIKPDGSKLYLVGTTNTTVYEYNLTTAWDTNTASYASKSFSVNSQDTIPTSLFFKPDGTKMYVGGGAGRDINEYNLSTAWDVSTASYNQTYSLGWGAAQYPTGLIFTSDGIKMFVLNFSTDEIEEHSLSTAWDVSTASYVQNFDATSQGTGMRGLSFKDDGTKMYLVSNGNDTVYAYSSGPGVVTPTITYNSAIEFAGGTAPTSPAVGDTDVLTFSTRNGGTSYQSVLAIDGAA